MKSARLAAAGALLASGLAARAQDTNAVIDAWIAAQAGFRTWSADFVQTRSFKALTQPLVSTGRVWFAVPNRFRWELGSPAQTIAVRDGDQLTVIYPRMKRAERYPLSGPDSGQIGEALTLLEAGFPQSRADLDRRFRVLSLTATNAAWDLILQPASAATRRMLPEIRVVLATNNFAMRANELTFVDGSRLRNDFTNAVVNPVFDEAVFRPPIGPDYKVVEPLGK